VIELREAEKDALLKMDEGFALMAGYGLFGIHCLLIRGQEKILLHRSSFMRLRNEGLVRYRTSPPLPRSRIKDGAQISRLHAHLTAAGRKMAHELRETQRGEELADAG
jgi:hypothetical protein